MSYKSKLYLALFLVYVVWGSTFMGVKIALETLPPLLVSGLRFTIGGTILLLFTLLRGHQLPPRKTFLNSIFLGLLLTGIGNSSYAYAIHYIPSGIVALIGSTLPLWIFGLNYFFFEQIIPSKIAILGIVMGLVGMFYLINPMEDFGKTIPIFPMTMIIVGSISWAYGSLSSKNLELPTVKLQNAAIQMLSGGAFGLTISFLVEKNQLQAIAESNATTFWAMCYLIFVGTYVAYLAFLWLIDNASPQLASTYAFVNPIVALILGWAFLGELLNFRTAIAAAITLIGVVLMTMDKKKKIQKL